MKQNENAVETDPFNAIPKSPLELRQQLKSHLRWCAYLAHSIDQEEMSDLSDMLRETAQTMQSFADLAKHYKEAPVD